MAVVGIVAVARMAQSLSFVAIVVARVLKLVVCADCVPDTGCTSVCVVRIVVTPLRIGNLCLLGIIAPLGMICRDAARFSF